MNKALAIFAFLIFFAFLAILCLEVPSPDLVLVVLLTVGLAAKDFFFSGGR
ncbi:hypothetical protein [Poseidonocella sedimentorum]|uniref:Uncharacterized protein n=1 Tax=Poseidonocella sedimentorum TaxID=871652 RepID=A0A1I6CSH7_9RHOB|nr:hypothetical protein [Poseidonocella sedimentorum]SFQ96067.1 hypothetical protein SAMN04515673_101284 [Poseidonocella sedimentorum]